MKLKMLLGIIFQCWSLVTSADNGMIQMTSMHDVNTTMFRLEKLLTDRGMTIFTRIDHTQGAHSVGNTLPATQVLIFGNPKIGSPLMLCQPSIAIDLPQKMLAWTNQDGETLLAYNDPVYLAKRHGFSKTNPCYPILEQVSVALASFAEAATGLSELPID